MTIDHLAKIEREVGVTVAGDDLDASVSDFYRRCLLMLRFEQRQANPNIALITLLSDAVRFTREHCYLVGRYLGEIDAPSAGRARSEDKNER